VDTITKYCIYGERCSGTNYLDNLISLNFDAEFKRYMGWKHFFGFEEYTNTEDVLFICIIRNIFDWVNSFFNNPHQSPLKYQNYSKEEIKYKLLNEEFYSVRDPADPSGELVEIMTDRHIYTGERYKNIFEMRHIKNKFLIDDLPHKVNNSIVILYEDLLYKFDDTLNKIKNTGLKLNENHNGWKNVEEHKKTNRKFIKKEYSDITTDEIFKNENYIDYYEKKLYGNTEF
jgi:hypothetical protein